MNATTQNKRELEQFLDVLVAREPRGGLLEIRSRIPAYPSRLRQHWYDTQRTAAAAPMILHLATRSDVYIAVAPRRERRGGKSAIERTWVLWVDLDETTAREPITRPEIPPGIVIESGSPGHRHLYWPLSDPLNVPDAEHANRTLAHAIGADNGAVTNAAAILRPPGTQNFKHHPPTPVTLKQFDTTPHSVDAILRGLQPPLAPPARLLKRPAGGTADPLLRIEPARYVELLTGQPVPRGRKISCPFHQDTTPSLHAYPDPAQGWTCFGCGRSGSIYDLAGQVWGIPTRGAGFVELRQRLGELFLAAER
jgi:hypothetical protein